MSDAHPQPGDVIGDRYRLIDRIGRGGMAQVYRALDLRLGREVAVKVFRGDLEEAVDPQRTAREAQLLAGASHPAVVGMLDASRTDEEGGALPEGTAKFLVMELVPGRDLGALIAEGPVDPDLVRRVAADVADALAMLAGQGVVHRDVKPANILVLDEADARLTGITAKLSDFGIAKAVDGTRLTNAQSVLGTAAYLSPEQVRGGDVTAASDVYSLGLVLVEALTGQKAFPGPLTESALARLTRPPVLPADASPALVGLLTRMTTLEPLARPPAEEVAQALRNWLVGDMLQSEGRTTTAMPKPVPVALPAAPALFPERADAAAARTADAPLPPEPEDRTDERPVAAAANARGRLSTQHVANGRAAPLRTKRSHRRPIAVLAAGALSVAAITGVALALDAVDLPQSAAQPTGAPSQGAQTEGADAGSPTDADGNGASAPAGGVDTVTDGGPGTDGGSAAPESGDTTTDGSGSDPSADGSTDGGSGSSPSAGSGAGSRTTPGAGSSSPSGGGSSSAPSSGSSTPSGGSSTPSRPSSPAPSSGIGDPPSGSTEPDPVDEEPADEDVEEPADEPEEPASDEPPSQGSGDEEPQVEAPASTAAASGTAQDQSATPDAGTASAATTAPAE